ncbi:MAG TPA: MarR family transcriptional regulator [Solirubrobacteraceae bacterium]|nr:MarR family transcriptional regulator [Solirubrobacteraceae bacterium]
MSARAAASGWAAAAQGPEAPGSREAISELGRAFKACLGAMRRMRGREQRCHEVLSDAQYGLLFGLRESGPMATRELALHADLSPASATEMLEGLAAAGLVCRERSEQDRRVVLTSLTEHGRRLLDERYARLSERLEAGLAGFSDRELRAAAAVLRGLAETFDSITPAGRDAAEAGQAAAEAGRAAAAEAGQAGTGASPAPAEALREAAEGLRAGSARHAAPAGAPPVQ